MAFKGNKHEEKVFSKKIGFGLFKMVGFNPETNEDIKGLGFFVKDTADEPKYVDTTEEGTPRVRMDFFLEEVNSGYKWKEAFFIENATSMSKAEEGKLQKTEFINIMGGTSWVFSEDELTEKFKMEGNYHAAVKGESLLIDFLKKFINLDFKAEIGYDFKKFFNGRFKELKDDLASAETVIIPMTIKQQEGEDGEIKEFQNSFKAYARGSEYKFVNTKKDIGWTERDIELIKEKDDYNKKLFMDRKSGNRLDVKAKWINDIDKIVLKMVDDNYGCKNIYYLGKIRDYGGDALPSKPQIIDETTSDWT